MSERLLIAGVEVDQVAVDGIVYTYPADRINHEHIELAMGLSSSHIDGAITALDVNPEAHPGQGSYIIASQPQEPDFVTNMANAIDGRFEAMVENMLADRHKVRVLTKIAEHLEAGGTRVHAVPHGSLLDIGMMHGLMYVGLARLGAQFRAGVMISQGVTGLGYDFHGHTVELTTALSWACHKIWHVTPRTKKTEQSEFSKVVPAAQIDQQNRVVRSDIANEQAVGGMFITAALSATSDDIDAHGVHQVVAPTVGTLRTFAQPRTRITNAAGEILNAVVPTYELGNIAWRLSGSDRDLVREGDRMMEHTVLGMNAVVNGTRFGYRRAGKVALESFDNIS